MDNNQKLKALSIGYIVFAVLSLLAIPLMHWQIELIKGFITEGQPGLTKEDMHLIDMMIEYIILAQYLTIAVHLLVNITVAVCLVKRKYYWPCFIAGILTCMAFPIGTVLGVFTLLVLADKEVKKEFGIETPPNPAK